MLLLQEWRKSLRYLKWFSSDEFGCTIEMIALDTTKCMCDRNTIDECSDTSKLTIISIAFDAPLIVVPFRRMKSTLSAKEHIERIERVVRVISTDRRDVWPANGKSYSKGLFHSIIAFDLHALLR